VSLGGRSVGWLEAEVQQWLERRIEASRSERAVWGQLWGHHGFLKWKPLQFANRDNRLVTPIQELDSPILLRTIWFDQEKWKLGVNRFPPPVKSFPIGDLRMALDRERPMHRGPLAGQSFQSKDEMLQKLKADSFKDVKTKSSRNE
jgi:Prophage CP4-57 regulatory protein (AlpA)